MATKSVIKVLLVIVFAVTAGCATMGPAGHKYIMRGQILDVTGGTAYLCVGSRDGAQVGQEFTVYKFQRAPAPYKHGPELYFRKEKAGKIKITEVVDEHMAKAKVVSGDVKEHDVAELD